MNFFETGDVVFSLFDCCGAFERSSLSCVNRSLSHWYYRYDYVLPQFMSTDVVRQLNALLRKYLAQPGMMLYAGDCTTIVPMLPRRVLRRLCVRKDHLNYVGCPLCHLLPLECMKSCKRAPERQLMLPTIRLAPTLPSVWPRLDVRIPVGHANHLYYSYAYLRQRYLSPRRVLLLVSETQWQRAHLPHAKVVSKLRLEEMYEALVDDNDGLVCTAGNVPPEFVLRFSAVYVTDGSKDYDARALFDCWFDDTGFRNVVIAPMTHFLLPANKAKAK